MRPLVSPILVLLVVLCPLVCGVEEFDHGAHRHATSENHSQGTSDPTHCPEEADNCICQGAVRATDLRVPHGVDFGLLLVLDSWLLPSSHPTSHLTRMGSPTGLAGWGGALAVRSVLQNFRC